MEEWMETRKLPWDEKKSRRTVKYELGNKENITSLSLRKERQDPWRKQQGSLGWSATSTRGGPHGVAQGAGKAASQPHRHRCCRKLLPGQSFVHVQQQTTWGFGEAFITCQFGLGIFHSILAQTDFIFFWCKLGWSTLRSKLHLPSSGFQYS